MKAGREAREEETPIGSEAMAGFAAIGVVEAGRVHESRIVVGDSCTRPVSTMRRRDAARLRTEALRSSDPLCERDQRGLRDLRASVTTRGR